jgi:hypothetical protein
MRERLVVDEYPGRHFDLINWHKWQCKEFLSIYGLEQQQKPFRRKK